MTVSTVAVNKEESRVRYRILNTGLPLHMPSSSALLVAGSRNPSQTKKGRCVSLCKILHRKFKAKTEMKDVWV